MRLSPEYKAYLLSPRWLRYRERVLKKWGYRCAKCKKTGVLQVHHLNYARLGRELLGDCLPLCPACHERADVQRRAAAGWRGRALVRLRRLKRRKKG